MYNESIIHISVEGYIMNENKNEKLVNETNESQSDFSKGESQESSQEVNDNGLKNAKDTSSKSTETPPKVPEQEKASKTNDLKEKIVKLLENKHVCLALAIISILLLFMAIYQSSETSSLQSKNHELQTELTDTKQELENITKQYNDLLETPGVEIVAIRQAFEDEDWSKVVELAEDFEKDHKDSKENTEAQDLKTQAQVKLDEITKQEEEERKAKEEQERQAEAERQAAQQRQNEIANASLGEQNALSTAQDYLSVMGFSQQGLKEQLLYEGYSDAEAEFALNHLTVDWNVQAEKVAKSYIDTMSFSRQGLLEQLLYEGFTQEQAEHGVSAAGY